MGIQVDNCFTCANEGETRRGYVSLEKSNKHYVILYQIDFIERIRLVRTLGESKGGRTLFVDRVYDAAKRITSSSVSVVGVYDEENEAEARKDFERAKRGLMREMGEAPIEELIAQAAQETGSGNVASA